MTGATPIPADALDYFARCRRARTEIEGWGEQTRRAARLVSIRCPDGGQHEVGAVYRTVSGDLCVLYVAGRWHYSAVRDAPQAAGHHPMDVRGWPSGSALLQAGGPDDLPDAACPNRSCAFHIAAIDTRELRRLARAAERTTKRKKLQTVAARPPATGSDAV